MAVFSVAFTIIKVFEFTPIALSTVLLPKISSIRDKGKRIRFIRQGAMAAFGTGMLLLVAVHFFGKWGLEFLFTDRYSVAFAPLMIMSLGAVFRGLRDIFAALWVGGGVPSLSMYDSLICGLVILLASILLVPAHGYIGAAWAFTAGWVASVVVNLVFWIRYTSGNIELK